jgi:phage N-6-adenine-methyltransferase
MDMNNQGLFTSLADDWATPKALFDELDKEFSFTVDVCANKHNYKVDNYYSLEQDGLAQIWHGVVWMNPPYGRTIKAWMHKAYEAWLGGATVVCLVPARTDTAWWHDYAAKATEIRFIRGRVKFVSSDGIGSNPAPFPSAIVVFRAPDAK